MTNTPQWICFPVSREVSAHAFELGVDAWIWHPEEHIFNRSFRVHDIADVCKATILVSVDEGYTLLLNGIEISGSDGNIFSWSRPARVSILEHIRTGENQLRIEAYNTYLERPGAVLSLKLDFFDGTTEYIRTDTTWVTDSGENVGLVAQMGDMPWRVPSADVNPHPVVHFRNHFSLEQPQQKVKLKLSALGIVEVRIDGERPPDHPELVPGWTDYNKIVPFYELDFGSLDAGVHEIELMLASGWYAGYLGWERGCGYYGDIPAVYTELYIDDTLLLATDTNWSAGSGPWLEADLLMGVRYDARIQSEFDSFAQIFNGNVPELVSAEWEPVRVVDKLKPIAITKTSYGSHIVDFGQIIAGFVSFRATEVAGTTISIRHAEVLQSDGSLYFDNLRMARAEDIYTSAGQENETFRPFFTYHGFRYAEITGLSSEPDSEFLIAHQIKSDVQRIGSFSCDNELVNKIYHCYIGSAECTLVDIPTDCAQRDERLGWTGDGSILAEAHMQTFDVSQFYSKWLRDLFHAQRGDGALPDIAPYLKFGSGTIGWNNAAWSDAAVWVTSQLVKEYGSLDVARRSWDKLNKYAESVWLASENGYRKGGSYGDWLHVDSPTSLDFIGTTFHAIVNQEMVFLSTKLGHLQESARYSERLTLIKKVLDQRFTADIDHIEQFTQTACVLMLRFGLLSDEKLDRCAKVLVADILSRDTSLSTGFLGTPWLLDVLSEIGRSDLAVQLLKKVTFPSWGFMVKNGATALWEHWDSYTPEQGFKDPVMNSFSHASLGGFVFWFYKRAGWLNRIDLETRTIYIRPDVAPYLNHVSVSRITRLGKVCVDWEAGMEGISARIDIPQNAKAVLEQGNGQHFGSGIHHINIPYSKDKKHGNY